MKHGLRTGALLFCWAMTLFQIGVIAWCLDFRVSGFGLGIAAWNAVPFAGIAFALKSLRDSHLLVPGLAVGALAAAVIGIWGAGCCAMWWCEPDGQLPLVWLFLPVWETVFAAIAFGALTFALWIITRVRRRPGASERD